MGAHVFDAARSQHDLQHGEIQRLLGLTQRKVIIKTDIECPFYYSLAETILDCGNLIVIYRTLG